MNPNVVNRKIIEAGMNPSQVARRIRCTDYALSRVANGHRRTRRIVAKLVRLFPELSEHFAKGERPAVAARKAG